MIKSMTTKHDTTRKRHNREIHTQPHNPKILISRDQSSQRPHRPDMHEMHKPQNSQTPNPPNSQSPQHTFQHSQTPILPNSPNSAKPQTLKLPNASDIQASKVGKLFIVSNCHTFESLKARMFERLSAQSLKA